VEGAIEASAGDDTSDDAQADAARRIRAQLERMQRAEGNAAAVAKSIRVIPGVTSETILLSAEAVDADLIVVGARRRGFLARLVTTPTWSGLVERTTAALMIVPLRGDEPD
jgi:nucleotide-binding universal stress UspA family protein